MSTIGESVDVAATLSNDVIESDEANVEEGNSVKESEASGEDVDVGDSVKDSEVSGESVDVSLVSVDAAFAPSSKVVSVDEPGEEDVADACCALDSVNEVSDSRLTVVALVKSPAGDSAVVVASLEVSEVESSVDKLPLISASVRANADVVVSEPNVSLEVVPRDDVASTTSLPLTPLTVDVDASSEIVWVLVAPEIALEVDPTTLSDVDPNTSSVVV